LNVFLKHGTSSGTDSPQQSRTSGTMLSSPSPERVTCVLGP